MSFSTDLDAVRERAGLPVIYRLECRHHGRQQQRLITVDRDRAARFISQHALAPGDPHATYLEGPGRFRIRRMLHGSPTDPVWPWRLTDAERPGVFGRARTHAAAITLAGLMEANPGQHAQVLDDDDEVIAYVNGVGSGGGHINAPCSVTPVMTIGKQSDDIAELVMRRRRLEGCACGGVAGRHCWGCPRA